MSEKLYQVILLPHRTDSDVPFENIQKNLARAFKVDESKIEALFEKTPTIIKSGVDESTANLFRDAVTRSGAECEVREQASSPLPRPSSSQQSATLPTLTKEPAQEKIVELLRSFQPQAGLHVDPKIPEKKLKNAQERCRVHPMETIVGLIDCTVFGSAKHCLLLTNNGVYYSNDVQGSVPGGSIPYHELARRQLELDGDFEISLGKDDVLETSASPMERERILMLLTSIQKLFNAS